MSREFVLTAAHCMFKPLGKGKRRIAPNDFMVNVNDHDLTTDDGEKEVNVKKIIIHPKYRTIDIENLERCNWDYDFALLQLDAPQNQEYICLPNPGNKYTAPAVTAGWGLDDNNKEPRTPIEVYLVTSKNQDCPVARLTNNMICGSASGRIAGTCFGDSGGPLMVGKTIIGVVSRGKVGACGAAPTIFSRVTSQLAWIKSHVDGTCTGSN